MTRRRARLAAPTLAPLLAATLAATLAACGGDAATGAPSEPSPPAVRAPIASVRLSHQSIELAVGDAAELRAEALDTAGTPLAGRPFAWRTSDPSVVVVDARGAITAAGAGVAFVTAEAEGKSARTTVRVRAAGVEALVGRWRMAEVGGRPLPAVVRTMRDVVVDSTRRVALWEMRLDSARKDVLADGGYRQRFCFGELHDGALVRRECWGDHGRVASIDAAPPLRRVRFVSEYLDGLVAEGDLTVDGRLNLLEPLWHGAPAEATAWVRE